MSHNNEPIYTQDDMDAVLEKLRSAEKESERARQLLWAAVDAAGGHIFVPHQAWLDNVPVKELTMWDDVATLQLHLKTR